MADAQWRFPPTSRSVPDARRAVAARLDEWGMADLAETATLLVSEVVTNAVLHARTDITVSMTRRDDGIVVSISDGSPLPPSLRRHSTTSTTGRGMRLLELLADTWGAEPIPGGKVVSFTLSDGRDPWSAAEATIADADAVEVDQ